MEILIRGANWIGDAVMTIPAIRKLRTIFPDARLTLLTRPWAEGIFSGSGLVDDIVTSNSPLDKLKQLRKTGFDLAAVFPNSFSSAFGVRLAGPKRSFGFATERRSLLFTDPVEMPAWKDSRHEVFYYLELVAAIERKLRGSVTGFPEVEPRLELSTAIRESAIDVLRSHGINENLKTVAVAAGSTNSRAKRWIPERFAELIDRLRSEIDVNVVLLGSKDDKGISRYIQDLSEHKPLDLTGQTDVAGAAAILGVVDMLVSNDMGLAHVAPAVGTKTLVIFGPTNPATTRPLSSIASIISANVECAPCMLRDCPIDHRCMTRVSVDDVFRRVSSELSE